MTKDEAIDVEAERPSPCPFCNAELEPFGPNQHNHPDNDCWLARCRIERHELPAWNRRTPVSGEVAEGVVENCRLRLCLRDGQHAPDCTTYDPSRYPDAYAIPAQGIDHAPVPFIAWEVARHDTGAVEDLNAAEIRETWRSDHAKLDERAAFEAYMGKHGWFPHLFATSQDGSYQAREIHNLWSVWQARGQQAGVPEGWADDLRAIDKAMQHMGDALNAMDVVEDDDLNIVTPGFEAIARLIAAAPGEAG